ncbi:hypothetical protein [uncultured Treponema sp.]|uniref:hypothetical protein n=1 Tax=uncultured Treponema sp. TaxID=162155 RepID=UPI0025F738AB|nr:hypothetical protein [uncultured Treponema sp.]
MNKNFFLLFILLFLVSISCSRSYKIIGQWENEERILVFNDYDEFKIKYKNPKQIKSLSGKFLVNKNKVVLSFENFETVDGFQGYTDITDLSGYEEIMEFYVKENVLFTKITTTGNEYCYKLLR